MRRGQLKTCRLWRGHIHTEANNEKGPAIQKSEQYRLDREKNLECDRNSVNVRVANTQEWQENVQWTTLKVGWKAGPTALRLV